MAICPRNHYPRVNQLSPFLSSSRISVHLLRIFFFEDSTTMTLGLRQSWGMSRTGDGVNTLRLKFSLEHPIGVLSKSIVSTFKRGLFLTGVFSPDIVMPEKKDWVRTKEKHIKVKKIDEQIKNENQNYISGITSKYHRWKIKRWRRNTEGHSSIDGNSKFFNQKKWKDEYIEPTLGR